MEVSIPYESAWVSRDAQPSVFGHTSTLRFASRLTEMFSWEGGDLNAVAAPWEGQGETLAGPRSFSLPLSNPPHSKDPLLFLPAKPAIVSLPR